MRHILPDPKDPSKILGHFANPQPHMGTLEVADDDPRILAWVAERKRLKEEGLARSAEQRGLLARIEALEREVAKLKAQ